MAAPKVDPHLYDDLEFRGLLHQVTDPQLKKTISQSPITVYAGFDPTSDCLHVGNLMPLMVLRRFQQAGHRVIAVTGGATGMIGDPSGKSAERSLLTPEKLRQNLLGITKIISRFLNLKGGNPARVMDNAGWFAPMTVIDFLRDVGKHFTVNHMMAKDSVKGRLDGREHGISYTEFSYMLLQAYDFYHLYKKEGCRLQVGGSDQWGNITAGCELIRRMEAAALGEKSATTLREEVYGLTHPLVTKSDGSKFGKTVDGAIWLDAQRTSAYQFYQYFIRSSDNDVIPMLKYFTHLPQSRILDLELEVKNQPENRQAQKVLAAEMTELIHGAEAVQRCEAASKALFGREIKDLDSQTLLEVFADTPSSKKLKSDLKEGLPLIDLLVETQLCKSKGNAKTDLSAGGIYLNNERLTDPLFKINMSHLIAGQFIVLRKGKKTYHLIAFH